VALLPTNGSELPAQPLLAGYWPAFGGGKRYTSQANSGGTATFSGRRDEPGGIRASGGAERRRYWRSGAAGQRRRRRWPLLAENAGLRQLAPADHLTLQ